MEGKRYEELIDALNVRMGRNEAKTGGWYMNEDMEGKYQRLGILSMYLNINDVLDI